MTVATYIATWLRSKNISHVFTLPGGMIAPLLDAIHQEGATQLVSMYHEQCAGFAADGASRFARRPFVAMATSGPGATNLLTPLVGSYLDSVPAIYFVGHVQSYLQKGNRPLRQFALQECDFVSLTKSVVKGAWTITPNNVASALAEAYAVAVDGRPGPVLIEIPLDVQAMVVKTETAVLTPPPKVSRNVDPESLDDILRTLAGAERPLILAGGGIQIADAAERLRRFAERIDVPVACSMSALDVLAGDDPLRLGFVGIYGNRWVNTAVSKADVILVLGSRLDHGTIGADVVSFRRGRTILQVDCDPAEMQRVKHARVLQADLADFLDAALSRVGAHAFAPQTQWRAEIARLAVEWDDTRELDGCPGINPNRVFHEISQASAAAVAYVVDVGQHLFWACQSLRPARGQRIITAGGLGAIGFALPAAIGVAITTGRPVVALIGDGALQLNLQELQIVVRNRLPVKIVVINNNCHGNVRQLQESSFGGRYPTTLWGYSAPDFARIAEAFGIPGRTVSDPAQTGAALEWLWRDAAECALLDLVIPAELNVYPNVPFGAPLTTMESLTTVAVPAQPV